ncbi:hypothetical protein [Candidatus Villigracilis saccharophilus]|uniref:hypothetical protein n=1 Tax=Candidatus Villigracilis saccharophilus TaxID=3140684 RepID=UPI00313701D6|nr:hypothetical protein [Anaerolineales bacterium]
MEIILILKIIALLIFSCDGCESYSKPQNIVPYVHGRLPSEAEWGKLRADPKGSFHGVMNPCLRSVEF